MLIEIYHAAYCRIRVSNYFPSTFLDRVISYFVILTGPGDSAGVVGLSAALAIQEGAAEAGHDRRVTVLARDFPGPFETIDPTAQINYASPWGGAHNRLVPPTSVAEEDEHRMSIATSERMGALLHQSGPGVTGVTFMRGVEYLEDPGPQYLAITEEKARSELGMRGFRLLRPEELPDDKVAWGCEYETWCVNPMVYCSFLLRRFVFAGGRVVKKEVRDPAEIFSIGGELGPVDVVVNASGSGFGDPNVFPTRGSWQSRRNPIRVGLLTDSLQGKPA